MIFTPFDPTDIVSGKVNKVASGFWPNGLTYWSASSFQTDFFALTSSATPHIGYGTSVYDVRRTLYYLNVYPNSTYYANNDPYFSIAYGNINGDKGSGSFDTELNSMETASPKAIYVQYKNLLLGSADVDGKFSFLTGSNSSVVNGDDIFVINFSSYKFKNQIDPGLIEIALSGSNGTFTFLDDSPVQSQNQSVYNIVSGSLNTPLTANSTVNYAGIGLLYPNEGVVVLNASAINNIVGLGNVKIANWYSNYAPGLRTLAVSGSGYDNQANHYTFYQSLVNSNGLMKCRKSEYVPASHYFVRVKNQLYNYSNNPSYTYDGSDNQHPKGLIRNADFISDPRTYVTGIGLYGSDNSLLAIAKLSRPTLKKSDSELLIRVRVDF